jgi:hypothetical protein
MLVIRLINIIIFIYNKWILSPRWGRYRAYHSALAALVIFVESPSFFVFFVDEKLIDCLLCLFVLAWSRLKGSLVIIGGRLIVIIL